MEDRIVRKGFTPSTLTIRHHRPPTYAAEGIQRIRYLRLIEGLSLEAVHAAYPGISISAISRICSFKTSSDV